MIVFYFFLWTFILYWVHRAGHNVPFIRYYHLHHHNYIRNNKVKWHWNNLFLFNDDLKSTTDLWLTEVIPTLIFCIVFGTWYILLFYYVWAGLFQERIEHNSKINIPFLTSGKWHLIHHSAPCNYGLFFPIWDIIFRTYQKVR